MPKKSLSVLKRVRQAEKRRKRNRQLKNYIKSLTKRFLEADLKGKEELLPLLYSALDKAAKRRIYHPNNVARKKAKLAKLLKEAKEGSK